MPTPGFDDPALAAHPPGGNIWYSADVGASANLSRQGSASQLFADSKFTPEGGGARAGERHLTIGGGPPPLMFGTPETHTSQGEPIVSSAEQTRGHWTEILNFHGSPAPWILIAILLVAGVLHVEAKAGGGARVGR